jgi:hypothetical protein
MRTEHARQVTNAVLWYVWNEKIFCTEANDGDITGQHKPDT